MVKRNAGFKTLTIRVIPAEGWPRETKVFRAGAGKLYTEEGIDKLVDSVVDFLEKKWPHWEWRMVVLATDRVNFIYAGLRDQPSDGFKNVLEEACKIERETSPGPESER